MRFRVYVGRIVNSSRCLSTGYMHAVVAGTVRVVGEKLVSCKIDVGGVGRCGAVRHRIAPAIGDMLNPTTRGEEADTPHQIASRDHKGEG